MSDKFKKKVSPQDLEIVYSEFEKTSKKSLMYVDDSQAKSEKIAVEKLGVKITDPDIEPFVKAVQPMYKEAMTDPNKKDLLNAIFTLQGR